MAKLDACPSHCCPEHGCKYGHEDCPVELCDVDPVFPGNNGCEQCEAERHERRLGLALSYTSSVLENLGRFSDGQLDDHLAASLLDRDIERLVEEIARLTGDQCPRCHGHGTIAWGSGKRKCVACNGSGRMSPIAALAVATADALDAARPGSAHWSETDNNLDIDEALRRGKQVFEERHQ